MKNRRRPHILPPLCLSKDSSSIMEPLKPPKPKMATEGRLGSPIPRWHRPTLDELDCTLDAGGGNNPSIRITDDDGNIVSKSRPHWGSDLRNDPLFKEDVDLLQTVQRRNSVKTLGLDARKSHLDEKTPRLVKPGLRQAEGKADKSYLPNRYAPLKPIEPKYVTDLGDYKFNNN